MGQSNGEDAIQSFLSDGIETSIKAHREAEGTVERLPHDLFRKTYATHHDIDRVLFTTSDKIVVKLCRELSSKANVEGSRYTASLNRSIFGWCIRSVLWIRLGAFASEQTPRCQFLS